MLWFQCPKDCTTISVHQQTFEAEVFDAKGIGYFRAPEVFQSAILGIPGFEQQIPKIDLKTLEIKQHVPALQARIDLLESEIELLRKKLRDALENLNVAQGQIHEMKIQLKRVR